MQTAMSPGGLQQPINPKRKYLCTFAGCGKAFTKVRLHGNMGNMGHIPSSPLEIHRFHRFRMHMGVGRGGHPQPF